MLTTQWRDHGKDLAPLLQTTCGGLHTSCASVCAHVAWAT